MKKEIIPSILLSISGLILFCIVYPGIVWAIAQLAPGKGEGFTVPSGGKKYYENIAQKFTDDKYFWSRPSAVDYNAAGSGGSNKGPANPDFLKQVADRIDTFVKHNPDVKKEAIPVELVTASGSGLDPDMSLQGAMIQIPRIAKARHLTEQSVVALVHTNTTYPLAGMFGPEKVNVLKLNLALDNLSH